jgi:hypothetical protein
VRALPIERLARARAVDGGATHRAPPELVPPRLSPPAPHLRAQAQVGVLASVVSPRSRRILLSGRLRPPLHHEPAGCVLRVAEAVPAGEEHLPRRGVEQEPATGRVVAARAVAVLEAVPQLAERREVAPRPREGPCPPCLRRCR